MNSVAFITGRNEASRNETEVNLKAAGYGSLCKGPPEGIYAQQQSLGQVLPSHDDERGMLSGGPGVDLIESSARFPAVRHPKVRRPGRPCYVALHLRDIDDDRLASVYKPERRKALERDGFEIYANFGDQFSDLDGPYSAPHSYKLPNPAYLIL